MINEGLIPGPAHYQATQNTVNRSTPANTFENRPGPVLSVVIPFFNERPALPQCVDRVSKVCDGLGLSYEIVFIDDGSTDGGLEYLSSQAIRRPEISVIRLSRNFGKEAAMTAGLDYVRGDATIILDADLQDPPELIPEMIAAWQAGAEVVLMRRRSRVGDSVLKRATAHLYYRLLSRLSDHPIPPDVGDFRLLSFKAIDALNQLPERNRYMKGLFAWIGMQTTTLEYDRAPRTSGVSKWNYLGLLGLAFEGITSFSTTPLRYATLFGVVAAFAGGLFGLWIIFKTLVLGDEVHGYPSLMAVTTFLGGVQLLTVGLLGEYVGKTYVESKQRPSFLVSDIISHKQASCSARPSLQRARRHG